MVVAGALSAPVHSDLESHAACPSRLRRSISLFLHGVRSPAQALQDHAKQSSVCTMLNTDRCSPRQINMDCTGRAGVRRTGDVGAPIPTSPSELAGATTTGINEVAVSPASSNKPLR